METTMGADFIFRMGSTHAICQDYAIAGETAGHAYALLSDGCSGVKTPGQPGSPYTDFGARFLVRAAQQRLQQLARGVFPSEQIINHAWAMARELDLKQQALDATLLAAVTTSNGDVLTFQTGDGVVAARRRDGRVEYRTLAFGNGMPAYLSYLLDPERLGLLMHPDRLGEAVSPEALEAAGTVEVTSNTFDPRDGWGQCMKRKDSLDDRISPLPTVFYRDQVDVVLLMSDGAESFQTKDGAIVPLEKVLEQLFAFKGFQGEFVVRRCTRFLQKFCAENGWTHADDFSVAGIHVGAP